MAVSSLVPEKTSDPSVNITVDDGWTEDDKAMARMGKQQEFKRDFGWLSGVGFTSCAMGLPDPYERYSRTDVSFTEFVALQNFPLLVDGGTAAMFWTYCWVIFGQFFIVLSLAEMSSMAPTAGGQYHWVSEFAPRRHQKILSYISGWLSSLAWQGFVAADTIFGAQLLMALAQIHNPDLVIQNWYTALLSVLLITLVTAFNVLCAKQLATAEIVFVTLHVAGFFIVLITIAVTSPKTSAKEVFLTFSDNGANYPTLGLGVMVGQVSAMWNVLASDSIAHLSEEVKDASRVTPKTMVWSYLLNMPIALATLLVFLFAMTDIAAATSESLPLIWVLQNSLDTAGALGITALFFILMLMITTSTYASTTRQCFAFARDDGLPFPTWMKKVNHRLNVAANACYVTWGFTVVMCLIYIGSPIAFNAIVSMSIVGLMATYGISIGCVLWRRLKYPKTLPPVYWSLGRWGVLINGTGLIYAFWAFFWAFWPIYWDPTPQEMNYAIIMFSGIMLISAINYIFSARYKYVGPVATCAGREED